MAYLECIRACNNARLADYVPWWVDGQVYGWIGVDFAAQLQAFPEVFVSRADGLHFPDTLQTPAARTAAVDAVMRQLHAAGVVDTWVGETYPVVQAFGGAAVLEVERAAAAFLGVKSFGIHVNGLVQKADGLHVWTGVRTLRKPFWPGKLDQMVAGGMPTGMGLLENLIKEAQEEANIPASLAARAQAVTQISYQQASWRGLENSTIFVYDLWLPEDFVPVNTDGEVERFHLLPLAEVARLTQAVNVFKDNCNLVNIDLLLRTGMIQPSWPEYAEIGRTLYEGGGQNTDLALD